MKRLITGLCLCFVVQPLLASELWEFSNRIAVTAEPEQGIFHHLEGAGRKHIATSAGSISVVWEDDHSGDAARVLPMGGKKFIEFVSYPCIFVR